MYKIKLCSGRCEKFLDCCDSRLNYYMHVVTYTPKEYPKGNWCEDFVYSIQEKPNNN